MRLVLSVPDDFDFRNAVCSHGFFVLAPNRWDPVRQRLQTTIPLNEATAATVSVYESARRRGSGIPAHLSASGPVARSSASGRCGRPDRTGRRARCTPPKSIIVQTVRAGRCPGGEPETRTEPGKYTSDERARIREVITRMLRLDEDFSEFHARCLQSESHQLAATIRFGRLLRSASLFEDMVKVICTCNVTWRQTVAMVGSIVEHWGVPSRETPHERGFPTPARLARATVDELRIKARLGYRAAFVNRLAVDAAEGRLDLAKFDHYSGPTASMIKELRRIHGIGDYAAAHVAMLSGRYDQLAIDTELVRLLKARHPRRRWTPGDIRRHYQPWHPFQFLAYWFELWQDYVSRHGRSEGWHPSTTGLSITSSPARQNRRRN